MRSNAAEIEQILSNGKVILDAHPEFMNMSLDKVIDHLDDGTEQMIRDRWGTAAWIVIEGLKSFETCDLIEQLAQVKSGPLTYEYVGYLLQNNYDVSLEALIIEAHHQHKFSEMVKFVSPNLQFEKKIYKENIPLLLELMENHISEAECNTLIRCYAGHINNMHAQCLVLDMIGELNSLAEYRVVCHLQRDWYLTSRTEAIAYIDKLIAHQSMWSKKAALSFLDVSLYHEQETFRSRFSEVEEMINAQTELWEAGIPILIHFIVEAANRENEDDYYNKSFSYLSRISAGTISEKCIFMESIQLRRDLTPDLRTLFYEVAASPSNKDSYFIKLIADALYFPVSDGRWQEAIGIMIAAFCANGYLADYSDFFAATEMLHYELAKYSVEISTEALGYLLSGNASQVFFGLGLLMHVGNLNQIPFDDSNALTGAQLIRAMKGILYYAANDKKICQAAFELLRFGIDCDEYIGFFMDSVYGNYPMTLASTAKNYLKSDNILQKRLAEDVLSKQEQASAMHNRAYEIKDLQPSAEHNYIYRRAMAEQSKQINQKANEQSILGHLFSTRVLKYGVRSAFVTVGRGGDKSMRVFPFQTISCERELPAKYIENPVGYAIERQRCLKELKTDAVADKRVYTSVEGER